MNEEFVDKLLLNVGDIALRRRSKSILMNIDPKDGDNILEVGCGDGFYLYVLSNLNKNNSTPANEIKSAGTSDGEALRINN